MTRRTGTTLMELTLSLALLAGVLAVGSKLMIGGVRTLRATHEATAQSGALDLTLGRLKRDVWSAHRVEMEEAAVTLHGPDGRTTWRVGEDGRVVRRVGEDREQVWPDFGRAPRFVPARDGLIVELGDGPGMLIVSQTLRGGVP